MKTNIRRMQDRLAATLALIVLAGTLLTFGLGGGAARAQADDKSERLALAKQVVALTDIRKRLDPLLDPFAKMIVDRQPKRPGETPLRMFEVKSEVAKMIEGITEDIAAAYAETLTSAELKEVVAFRTSIAGRKAHALSEIGNPVLAKIIQDRSSALASSLGVPLK